MEDEDKERLARETATMWLIEDNRHDYEIFYERAVILLRKAGAKHV